MFAVVSLSALSLAACGSSSTSSPSSSAKTPAAASASPSSTTPAPAGPMGKDQVRGIVGNVAGGTVTVNEANGSSAVDVTPATKITQLTAGQLTDITPGQCLMVNPTKDGNTPPNVTAAALLFGAPDNGQCLRPNGNGPGRRLGGTVASVNGNSIVLTTADNSQTTVTVTPNTRYAKRIAADASAIAAGQCLAARGQKDNNGALQATFVSVRPSNNGKCGGGRKPS